MSYFDFVEQDRLTPGMSGEPAGMSDRGYADPVVQEARRDPGPPSAIESILSPFGRGSAIVDPTIWSDLYGNLF